MLSHVVLELYDCACKNLCCSLFVCTWISFIHVSVTLRKFFPFCNKVRGWACGFWQHSFINLSSLHIQYVLFLCCLLLAKVSGMLISSRCFVQAAIQIIALVESKQKLCFWKTSLFQKAWYKICWSPWRVEVNSCRSVSSLGRWWAMASMGKLGPWIQKC